MPAATSFAAEPPSYLPWATDVMPQLPWPHDLCRNKAPHIITTQLRHRLHVASTRMVSVTELLAKVKTMLIQRPNHIHMVLSVSHESNVGTLPQKIGCLRPPIHGDICNNFHHNSKLARIAGSFKAAVSGEYPRIWRRLYHEHIIRNQLAFDNIMEYVNQNAER